ncbi:hypothetical protein [Parabacteroides sp. AM08-6]|uniref:hypothetical protein n=1 Tax=Parabacteroides sp. AM08-6 TaxID=2292053 RepID=UPI0018F2E832|nr:hypothetical protein [Parabacteroides sp. AM08-6]
MYVEKDSIGKIIIQDISPAEAEILDDCICSYLSGKPANTRTVADKVIINLKRQLEKLY